MSSLSEAKVRKGKKNETSNSHPYDRQYLSIPAKNVRKRDFPHFQHHGIVYSWLSVIGERPAFFLVICASRFQKGGSCGSRRHGSELIPHLSDYGLHSLLLTDLLRTCQRLLKVKDFLSCCAEVLSERK